MEKLFLLRTLSLHLAVFTILPVRVDAWSKLIEPSPRDSVWRYGYPTPTHKDGQINCGGFEWNQNGGRCGMCGTRWIQDNNSPGITYLSRIFIKEDSIKIVIGPVPSKSGWFEFRVCHLINESSALTQECFDHHLLRINNSSSVRFQVTKSENILLRIQLPKRLSCNHCVLQWKYNTGIRNNPQNRKCSGCGPQEEFYNCANIAILDNLSTSVVAGLRQYWNSTMHILPARRHKRQTEVNGNILISGTATTSSTQSTTIYTLPQTTPRPTPSPFVKTVSLTDLMNPLPIQFLPDITDDVDTEGGVAVSNRVNHKFPFTPVTENILALILGKDDDSGVPVGPFVTFDINPPTSPIPATGRTTRLDQTARPSITEKLWVPRTFSFGRMNTSHTGSPIDTNAGLRLATGPTTKPPVTFRAAQPTRTVPVPGSIWNRHHFVHFPDKSESDSFTLPMFNGLGPVWRPVSTPSISWHTPPLVPLRPPPTPPQIPQRPPHEIPKLHKSTSIPPLSPTIVLFPLQTHTTHSTHFSLPNEHPPVRIPHATPPMPPAVPPPMWIPQLTPAPLPIKTTQTLSHPPQFPIAPQTREQPTRVVIPFTRPLMITRTTPLPPLPEFKTPKVPPTFVQHQTNLPAIVAPSLVRFTPRPIRPHVTRSSIFPPNIPTRPKTHSSVGPFVPYTVNVGDSLIIVISDVSKADPVSINKHLRLGLKGTGVVGRPDNPSDVGNGVEEWNIFSEKNDDFKFRPTADPLPPPPLFGVTNGFRPWRPQTQFKTMLPHSDTMQIWPIITTSKPIRFLPHTGTFPAQSGSNITSAFHTDSKEMSVCRNWERYNCLSIGPFRLIPGMNWWCVVNCGQNNCPTDKCRCNCIPQQSDEPLRLSDIHVRSGIGGLDISTKRPTTIHASGQLPDPSAIGSFRCEGTSVYKDVEGINEWCRRMCMAGVCPRYMCRCYRT